MSVIVAFLFAISLWYLSINHKVTSCKPEATLLKSLPCLCWHRLTSAGGTFVSATTGTFVSATGGTFESDTGGTFESDTGGTFIPLLSDKVYILDDKTFGGPLLQQYNRAIEWLKGKLQVSYEITGTGPRKETWEIPLSVFKESIINALAHRDYYEQGASIMIEMYDDRVEITNPGDLPSVVARNFGRRSLSRNPLIFGLFTRMHLVEHVGSGIPRMRKDMLDAGLPEPIFETGGMFTVIFMRPAATQAAKHESNEPQITPIQQGILSAITDKPTITMNELGAMLSLGRSSIYNNIKQLKEQGILTHEGRKRDGRWVVF